MEATLYMPIAIFLMVGGVDFGMAFSAHATVGKSVRDAARYLGSLPTWPTPVACNGWAILNAQNLAVYGNIAGTGSPLIPGWLPANVNVSFQPDCSDPDFKITVSASPTYTTLMLGTVFPGIATLPLPAQHVQESAGGFDG